MHNHFLKSLLLTSILAIAILASVNAQNITQIKKTKTATEQKKSVAKYKVTFIEFGSSHCIPCQQMQLVMKSIEKKYNNQVKVIFHDVWTPEGKPYADKYNIQMIPVQILLDENEKEFFRHEGFLSEEKLLNVLKTKDVH